MRIQPKGRWHTIDADCLKGYSDLVSIEEITDYEILNESGATSSKIVAKSSKSKTDKTKKTLEGSKKKKIKKIQRVISKLSEGNTDQTQEKSETDQTEETVDESKKKKKRKRNRNKKKNKASKQVVSENAEVTDADNGHENGESVVTEVNEIETATPEIKNVTKKKSKRKSDTLSATEPPNKKQKLEADKNTTGETVSKKKKKQKKKKPSKVVKKPSVASEVKCEQNEGIAAESVEPMPVTDMSQWDNLFVPDVIRKNLAILGFSTPTLVQKRCLPSAIQGKTDVVVAAETGSGKTLAFGIPLVASILRSHEQREERKQQTEVSAVENAEEQEEVTSDSRNEEETVEKEEDNVTEKEEEEDEEGEEEEEEEEDMETNECSGNDEDENLDNEDEESQKKKDEEDEAIFSSGNCEDDENPLFGLILTPTRELAFQIRDHLRAIAKDTSIKCHAIVGGMSIQKQSRVLEKECPEIIVATPGRLWDIYKQHNKHLKKLPYIRCLVIDEADRMVEKFHFEHLSFILTEVNRTESRLRRQTFVLSATLTYVPPKPHRLALKKKKKHFHDMTTKEKLETLCKQIGIREDPKIIDLTPIRQTAANLTETRIVFNTVEEKDLFLYCFLKEYSGRTIVFANSIDCVWRLMKLFTLLGMSPLRLFADMQQKHRLKSLEKFKENPQSLLLATDVAARGLDIPGIEHVIHYEVPKTTESYIHRSGRTARANSEGFSILFVGPKEISNYRKLMKALNRDDLSSFSANDDLMYAAKERLTVARKVELEEYNLTKNQNKQVSALAKEAETDEEDEDDVDINQLTVRQRKRLVHLAKLEGFNDLNELEKFEDAKGEDSLLKKLIRLAKQMGTNSKANQMYDEEEEYEMANKRRGLDYSKKQLKVLLSQPLISRSSQTRYPTQSGQMVYPFSLGQAGASAIEKWKSKPAASRVAKDAIKKTKGK